MSETERLRDKLRKLAAEDDGTGPGGRRLDPGPSGDLAAAILAEIDETILGRILSFENDAGEALIVEAASRRLLSVLDAPERCLGPDRAAITAPIQAEAHDQVARIGACLASFVEGQSALSVVVAPLDRRPDPSNVGRSAKALAEVFANPAAAPPAESGAGTGDRIAAFLARIAADARASAVLDANLDVEAAHGNADGAALAAAASGLLSELGRKPAERAGRFASLAAGESLLFVASDGERSVVVLAGAAARDPIAAHWTATGA